MEQATKNVAVKPKIVILEGVDRTGKTTMMKEINEQTNYKHILMDRGSIGYKVYGHLNDRPKFYMREYDKIESALADLPNVLVIYLSCSTEELLQRCEDSGHEILNFDAHKAMYDFVTAESLYKSKIFLDTTEKSPAELVKELINIGVL